MTNGPPPRAEDPLDMVELTLIGTDFRQVPPSRLESLAKRTEHIRANLVDLRERGAIQGGVLVSTCNRIEAVLDVAPGRAPASDRLGPLVLGCPEDFPVFAHHGLALGVKVDPHGSAAHLAIIVPPDRDLRGCRTGQTEGFETSRAGDGAIHRTSN